MPPNGWTEWSKFVLKELERLNECYEQLRIDMTGSFLQIREEIAKVRIEVGMLKVKAGVWGLLGGLIPAIGILLIWLIKTLKTTP